MANIPNERVPEFLVLVLYVQLGMAATAKRAIFKPIYMLCLAPRLSHYLEVPA